LRKTPNKDPGHSAALDAARIEGQTTRMLILKIFRSDEWAALQAAGRTTGAPIDRDDGYIHFSTPAQVGVTAAKYFAETEGLMLIACDADTMGAALRWEVSRGGDLFPHLYRELTLEDVLWAKPLPCGPDGHVFPREAQ